MKTQGKTKRRTNLPTVYRKRRPKPPLSVYERCEAFKEKLAEKPPDPEPIDDSDDIDLSEPETEETVPEEIEPIGVPEESEDPFPEPSSDDGKHIHPCICDLSKKQRDRIRKHVKWRRKFESKLDERLEEIDAERIALEEEIQRKLQEEKEQQELFGDQYEVIGKKKKRLKRSARRASMVSLGVKQVISWKKSPKIKVKGTNASKLRSCFRSYCGDRGYDELKIRKIDFENAPKIPVRITKTSELRSEANTKKKRWLILMEDKKRRFINAPPV